MRKVRLANTTEGGRHSMGVVHVHTVVTGSQSWLFIKLPVTLWLWLKSMVTVWLLGYDKPHPCHTYVHPITGLSFPLALQLIVITPCATRNYRGLHTSCPFRLKSEP